MICNPCAKAADAQLPRSAHCLATGGPGTACDCQHRTDRYRTRPQAGVTVEAAVVGQPVRGVIEAAGRRLAIAPVVIRRPR